MRARRKICGTMAAIIVLALVGTIALAGCSSEPAGSEDMTMNANKADSANMDGDVGTNDAYKKITADEAQSMMESGSPTIVDVRTPQEYTEGHVPGAINIPVESIGTEQPAELTDPDAELIVYCRTGVRSKQASDKLVSLGYQHVNDMGGIVDWTGDIVTGDQPS